MMENVPTVSNTNKQSLFLVGILKATEEKSRIRIRNLVVRNRGLGSVSKRHTDPEHWNKQTNKQTSGDKNRRKNFLKP